MSDGRFSAIRSRVMFEVRCCNLRYAERFVAERETWIDRFQLNETRAVSVRPS